MRTPWPRRRARPSNSALRMRLEAVGLAGVHGDREELAGEVVERGAMRGSAGSPASAPAMSKPTTPRVAVAHGELGDLESAVGVAHRGDELAGADARWPVARVVDALPRCPPAPPRPPRRGVSPRARCCSGAQRISP